jgi:hypothetical protein
MTAIEILSGPALIRTPPGGALPGPRPAPCRTPVFFLRDPLKFPDLNHAVKDDGDTAAPTRQDGPQFPLHPYTLYPLLR